MYSALLLGIIQRKKLIEMRKWKRFEKLVQKVQEELAPNAKVILDDRLKGNITGVSRQVDITVTQKLGQYNILIVIDCKDLAVPVDVKHLEEFIGLVQDIGANKGVIVSAKGFTRAAKTRGSQAGLNLYRLVDTEKHDWQVMASIPVVCEMSGPKKYSISFSGKTNRYFKIPLEKPGKITIYNEENRELGTIEHLLEKNWNDEKYPDEPGKYEGIDLIDGTTKFKFENHYFKVDIKINLLVERRIYFGNLPIENLRGFRNELTGKTITRGFTTGVFSWDEVQKHWKRITSIDELAVEPILIFKALDVFPIQNT